MSECIVYQCILHFSHVSLCFSLPFSLCLSLSLSLAVSMCGSRLLLQCFKRHSKGMASYQKLILVPKYRKTVTEVLALACLFFFAVCFLRICLEGDDRKETLLTLFGETVLRLCFIACL